MKKFKAAIFDMDGTILDSMYIWHHLAESYLIKNNIPIPEDLADIGTTSRFVSLPTHTACAKMQLPICCSVHAKNSNKHLKRRAFSYDQQRSLPRAVRR